MARLPTVLPDGQQYCQRSPFLAALISPIGDHISLLAGWFSSVVKFNFAQLSPNKSSIYSSIYIIGIHISHPDPSRYTSVSQPKRDFAQPPLKQFEKNPKNPKKSTKKLKKIQKIKKWRKKFQN